MSNFQFPDQRLMNSEFKKRGREDVVMIDAFPIRDGDLLKLSFESINSPRQQGVWLKTDDGLVVNQQQSPSIQLWQHSAPQEVLIECHTRTGCLLLYNIWDAGHGPESQSFTSGMLVEELPSGRRYRCNDFGFDPSFDRLVFRLRALDGESD